MHMTIHPHDEGVDSGGGKGGGLNNGDIIAIVGIFATIIVAIFSKWLLDLLRKTFGGVATVRTNFLFISVYCKFKSVYIMEAKLHILTYSMKDQLQLGAPKQTLPRTHHTMSLIQPPSSPEYKP